MEPIQAVTLSLTMTLCGSSLAVQVLSVHHNTDAYEREKDEPCPGEQDEPARLFRRRNVTLGELL